MVRKIGLILTGIIIGGFMGMLYNGAYMDHRIMVKGQNIIELSESEIMEAMVEDSANLVQETFVSFWGFGGVWIKGSWPMWFSLIGFIITFGYSGYYLNNYLENKNSEGGRSYS